MSNRKNFTAKHFIVLAAVLKQSKPAEPTNYERDHLTPDHWNVLLGRKAMHEQMVNDLCTMFANDNPLFREKNFRAACGYEP